MFEIKSHKCFPRDMHRIVSNHQVLFNDGENDILYTGTNIYGNVILGIIVYEHDEKNYLRYIHVIVDDVQYLNFFTKKITLREILSTNESFFIVDKNYNNEEISNNLISFDELPEEFKPLKNSFCPTFLYKPSLEYYVSLQGGLSDLHKATPEDLNLVNTKFSQFLKSSSDFLNQFEIGRNVYIEAGSDNQYGMTGSFKVKFRIDLNKPDQLSLISASTDKISDYFNKYFNYVFQSLPEESNDVFKKDTVTSPQFKEIETLLTNIYVEGHLPIPEAGLEHKLIDIINYSVENLKDIEYTKGFERISFLNYTEAGHEIPIGIIDKDFIPIIEEKLFRLESENKEDVIFIDSTPQDYVVQVYHFSTETGNGGAYFFKDDGSVIRIQLHVKGKKNYGNTIFTKSMDEVKKVPISGIAKFVNSKIKEITVDY